MTIQADEVVSLAGTNMTMTTTRIGPGLAEVRKALAAGVQSP